jgi:uncharacterized membrane protein required for colicin V production
MLLQTCEIHASDPVLSPMSLDKLPVNAFDCIVLAVLVIGLMRGRKHGMSEELIGLVKWLAVVIGCAFVYEPAGQWFASTSPFSLLASFIMVYVTVGLLILSLFAVCKYRLGGKLIGSDIFGRAEYYLGMGSGVVRISCMLLAFLALLNARYFSPMEVRAMVDFQNDVYGSNYFPTWHTAQEVVFEKSITGVWIKDHLGFFLIKPTQPEDKQFHQKEASLP